MFSKTVDFFSGISKLPSIDFFKIIIKGIKFLAVQSTTEKFQLYQLILWIDEWIIKSMKARYFTDRKMSFLVYE